MPLVVRSEFILRILLRFDVAPSFS
jgi:hypothetical protein